MNKIICILIFLISNTFCGFAVYVYTTLDNQSYYASAIEILINETTTSLEHNDPSFKNRLLAFKVTQSLTYENKGNLLENLREFKKNGDILRKKQP